MKLLDVAPSEGAAWVRSAFRVFVRQPLGFAALFAACLFLLMLFGLVPVVGTIALLILAPAGSLLFMIATRLAEGGKAAMPHAFAELATAGRQRLLPVLKLGLVYAATTFLIFWLSGLADGGALEAFFDSLSEAKPEAAAERLADPRLQFGIALRLGLAGLLSVPFWHAPGLAYWGGQGWSKALFFSSVAIWRNKGAFTVYGLVWAGLWMLMLVVASVFVGVFGQQRLAFVATPLLLLFTTVFYLSLWFTFAGCFADPNTEPPPAGA